MAAVTQQDTQQDQPEEQPVAVAVPTNVLVVGVGGQGVITVSKMLTELCMQHNLPVKQSEVHGMAKRGGSVFSHVRFGGEIHSPTIPVGKVDILLAMEWAEGLRWLHFLNPDSGIFIVDTQQIIPPFSCRNRTRGAGFDYVYETLDQVMQYVPNAVALDATSMAAELGNSRAANTILLGKLSTALKFTVQDWQSIIARSVPPKTIDINRKAFALGRDWQQPVTALNESHAEIQSAPIAEGFNIDFEIVDAWCKGCDICVKMCPERCLILNTSQIVELNRPEACTGCRICEWLCPDMAIKVHVAQQTGAAH